MKVMNRKAVKRLSTLAVCAVLVGTVICGTTKHVYAAENVRKITVSGTGKIKVKPNIAYLEIGVTTEDADAKKSQDKNTEKMKKVLEAVKAFKIEDKDVQTSNYSIYPIKNYVQGQEQKITGYTTSNTIRVTVRDLTKVGEIFDKSIAAGANVESGISFSIEDTTAYYEQALAAAIKNASVKANAIAKTLNVKIETPSEVIETGGSYTPVLYGARSVNEVAYDKAVTPIQEGQLEVVANIQVSYQY